MAFHHNNNTAVDVGGDVYTKIQSAAPCLLVVDYSITFS